MSDLSSKEEVIRWLHRINKQGGLGFDAHAALDNALLYLRGEPAKPSKEQNTEALAWSLQAHEDLAKMLADGGGNMLHVRANRALGILFAEVERLEKILYPIGTAHEPEAGIDELYLMLVRRGYAQHEADAISKMQSLQAEHSPELMAVVDKWQDNANSWRKMTPNVKREDADLIDQILQDIRGASQPPPDVPSVDPIARVFNNNQPGWTNIVETAPNVTLEVGAPLYSRESVMRLAAALAGAIHRADELEAALRYYRDEYTGHEPSVSVFDRMVDKLIGPALTKSEPTAEGALKELRQRLGLPGETSGDRNE